MTTTALNALTANLSAFATFTALLDAAGNYRPTVHLKSAGHVELADAYDAAQAARGDSRRAFRVGTFTAPAAPAAPAAPKWAAWVKSPAARKATEKAQKSAARRAAKRAKAERAALRVLRAANTTPAQVAAKAARKAKADAKRAASIEDGSYLTDASGFTIRTNCVGCGELLHVRYLHGDEGECKSCYVPE
jgi:hypothetical protein